MEGLAIESKKILEVELTDYALVSSPLLNKGMSFTLEERDAFLLHGIIPTRVASLSEQRERSYQAYTNKATPIEKYIYLRELQDSNETLFYSLLCEHLEEMMPIVYTPTVGLGCQKFSHIYRRPRGLFISYPLKDQIDQMLSNRRFEHVEVIVATDGERILGLGDQGANGMGISIGKLAIYTACAGIHPRKTLPIVLDVGTDNPEHINDPLYIGWKNERIRGEKYDAFIHQFVQAVKKRFPNALLQWEDFDKSNATKILHKYKEEICTFNDDVQGTAAVVLASFIAASQGADIDLKDHRIVIAGAGSAGCGIANLILDYMEFKGLDRNEMSNNFFLFDRQGLITSESQNVWDFQKKFCVPKEHIQDWKVEDPSKITLLECVENAKPTVLIGVSGQAGLFTEKIVRAMAKNTATPIIFPLSNPTSCAEATPANIMLWTQEKAIISTGSPFLDITRDGKPFRVDQTNNSYIFPGLGLGVISCKAKKITESMILKAAETLSNLSPICEDKKGNLLPPLSMSRHIAYTIALEVAKKAIKEKVAPEIKEEELKKIIAHKMWFPEYLEYRKKKS